MLSEYSVLRTTKTPNSAEAFGHGGANHAEYEREMDDDDSTEASIRRLLDLPKRPLAQAGQIHNEVDGEGDKHVQAPEFHTAPVDACQIALAVVVRHGQDDS
jgi:hypothetical protein